MKSVKLYDQYGYRLPQARLFESALTRTDKNQASYTNGWGDIDQMVQRADWLQLLSAGRTLFALFPVVQGALVEQSTYSFPLQARFEGADREWGNLAEDALYNWRQSPTIYGLPYDDRTLAATSFMGHMVDGDIFRVKVLDDDGIPRIQPVRAHRCGPRGWESPKYILRDGPYKGNRICNGAVLDKLNRRLAYRVIGDVPEQDIYVPANLAGHVYDPFYTDETRGISKLSVAIRTFSDLKRLREFELIAMQVQSALAVTERNETGLVGDEGVEAITYGDRETAVAGDQASLDVKSYGEGMITFVKANTGQGIELHSPNRPGADWQSFHDRMTSSCLQGIEWEPSFATSMNEPGGNWGRVKLQKVNRRIMKNGFIEARTRKSEDVWYLAWRIENGLLRPPSDGDIFSWVYHLTIPSITGDTGNEESARREAYKLGLTSLLRISARDGSWWEDERKQREVELRNKYDMVLRLMSDYPDLEMSAQEFSNDIEMKNPNGPPAAIQSSNSQSETADAADAGDSPAQNGNETESENNQAVKIRFKTGEI